MRRNSRQTAQLVRGSVKLLAPADVAVGDGSSRYERRYRRMLSAAELEIMYAQTMDARNKERRPRSCPNIT